MLLRSVLLIALAYPSVSDAQDQQQPDTPIEAAKGAEAAKPTTFEEQVVVSASRAEEQLLDAPATVSVITAATIQRAPSVAMGDLLRVVPGVNVVQLSARDVNIT